MFIRHQYDCLEPETLSHSLVTICTRLLHDRNGTGNGLSEI